MNYYKFYFIIAFIWALIYTFSFFVHQIKNGRNKSAVNALICCILGSILCVVYLIVN